MGCSLNHAWIARVPMFIRLCTKSQQALDAHVLIRAYPKGGAIFLEGHHPTGLCMVVSGLVRIYRMLEDGKMHVHTYVRPYATCNVIAALDGRPNPTSAAAMTDTQIGWLPREALITLMANDADLMMACIRLLTLQNRELMARADDLSFRTVPSRLARLLLQRGGFEGEANIPLDSLSQDEIAAVLGTSREVLGRALRQLYDLGLMRREGRKYVIIDRAGLETLAGE
ncbi:MAG TPA: Crp/Fnr family transcriptional regulator [Aggregatilineales bacterium]|nr:Crp/Fnr family transcriptional regulator [Anaerolineales bacterium]HRE48366.1 Crp/Fnr family transcriptional regulator [Aggregatilineales bacterium]